MEDEILTDFCKFVPILFKQYSFLTVGMRATCSDALMERLNLEWGVALAQLMIVEAAREVRFSLSPQLFSTCALNCYFENLTKTKACLA